MADSWKARETLLPAARPVVTGEEKEGLPCWAPPLSCQFLISQFCCWNLRLSVKGYSFTLPLCVSVSSDRLRGLQASFSIPDSFAGFHILASAFRSPYEVLPAPSECMREPCCELALPRPPWTTIPSEPSGRQSRLRSGDRVA